MRKNDYSFGEFLLFLSPVLISLLLYSYREGALCRLVRIRPVMNKIYNEIYYVSDLEIYGVYEKEFRNIVFMTYEQALHRCSEDRVLYPF